MDFATHYFSRYKALPAFFDDKPDARTGIIVIIPCFDDEFVFHTLDSLENAFPARTEVEVIVNVNSGENVPMDIVERNRLIYNKLATISISRKYKNFRLLPILVEGTVRKKAGVGFARKTAMDEAVRRFAVIGRPDGLIVSLDADSLVDREYFREIEAAASDSTADCFTFQFRHNFDLALFDREIVDACRLYEIYLRYYRLALRTFDSPFAVHTIGSCFAIRAEAYTKLGGMPPRQGGEDFYFIQKAVKMRRVHEIRRQIVIPSPRVSNRVPFGTGPSVGNIIRNGGRYFVYNFGLFGLLRQFYELIPEMWDKDVNSLIHSDIMSHIGRAAFDSTLDECRKYSASTKAFIKRMYDVFDAFFIVKFLNTFNQAAADNPFPPVDVLSAAGELLSYRGISVSSNADEIYEKIVALDLADRN